MSSEILYLFKRAVDGVWVFGETSDHEHAAGMCRPAPNAARTELSIIYYTKSEGNRDRFNVPFGNFLKENGTAYGSFAELKAAYYGFFFRVSTIDSVIGMVTTDKDTGLKFRIIVRRSAICFDKELTATGFAGTVNVDWKETASFGSDV